jgi:hypothetical protein
MDYQFLALIHGDGKNVADDKYRFENLGNLPT